MTTYGPLDPEVGSDAQLTPTQQRTIRRLEASDLERVADEDARTQDVALADDAPG